MRLSKSAVRSGHESERRNRLHAPGSPSVLRTSRRGADADGGYGQAAAADDVQHRQGLAGQADPELVQFRSQACRADAGDVRLHDGAGSTHRRRQEEVMATDRYETRAGGRLRAPGLGLLLAEARGILEFNASLVLSPLLMRAPRGDGHPVLALPGFLASDLSMMPLRRYLGELGYDTHAWRMGRNTGGINRMRGALLDRLEEIHSATGRKVSVVGWSLGGVYARDLALRAPEMVRYVITLASPFAGD